MSYSNLISDVKLAHDSGDAWGSAMGAFFDLTAELWTRDDAIVPDEWRYSPGAAGGDPRDPDSYFFEVFKSADTADLERLGAVLDRYTGMLRSAGRDY